MDTKQHINLIESIKKVGEHDPMKILPYTQAQWEQHKKNQEAKDKEDKQAKERESRDKAVEVLLKSKLGDKNTSITKTPRPQINIRTGERTNENIKGSIMSDQEVAMWNKFYGKKKKGETKSGAEDEPKQTRDPNPKDMTRWEHPDGKKTNEDNLLAKHWKKIHASRAREAQEKKDAEEKSAKENKSAQYNSNEIRDRVEKLRRQEFDTGSFEESVEVDEATKAEKKKRQLQNRTAVAYAKQKTELEPGEETAKYNRLADTLDKLRQSLK
jgi:hypothetical protein